jgi:hypothetical protein
MTLVVGSGQKPCLLARLDGQDITRAKPSEPLLRVREDYALHDVQLSLILLKWGRPHSRATSYGKTTDATQLTQFGTVMPERQSFRPMQGLPGY